VWELLVPGSWLQGAGVQERLKKSVKDGTKERTALDMDACGLAGLLKQAGLPNGLPKTEGRAAASRRRRGGTRQGGLSVVVKGLEPDATSAGLKKAAQKVLGAAAKVAGAVVFKPAAGAGDGAAAGGTLRLCLLQPGGVDATAAAVAKLSACTVGCFGSGSAAEAMQGKVFDQVRPPWWRRGALWLWELLLCPLAQPMPPAPPLPALRRPAARCLPVHR
jgi:hypothetical protein